MVKEEGGKGRRVKRGGGSGGWRECSAVHRRLHATLSSDRTSALDEHQEGLVVVAVVAWQSAAGGPFDSGHLDGDINSAAVVVSEILSAAVDDVPDSAVDNTITELSAAPHGGVGNE